MLRAHARGGARASVPVRGRARSRVARGGSHRSVGLRLCSVRLSGVSAQLLWAGGGRVPEFEVPPLGKTCCAPSSKLHASSVAGIRFVYPPVFP